ncbi:nuclear transport factor 2 family protein [Streptomyces sp. NPDC051985]|uniref:nuclear transport factor 2 family protein n=1 Tax=Streptomyces sp. NPDC051985 TaxID=3155807 RepID=UPI003425A949
MDQDALEIRQLTENWALWRDAGRWDRFATVWHPVDGYMHATWFHGPAPDFIEASRQGFEQGVAISHFLGGHTSDVEGDRAVAETKMTITQRSVIHGVPVEVVCAGRFYDFLARWQGAWKLVRRQPVYESDRLHVLEPGVSLKLAPELLDRFPVGYRHLAYVQTKAGFEVADGLPGLRGEAVETLYRLGEAWLRGAASPFPAGAEERRTVR